MPLGVTRSRRNTRQRGDEQRGPLRADVTRSTVFIRLAQRMRAFILSAAADSNRRNPEADRNVRVVARRADGRREAQRLARGDRRENDRRCIRLPACGSNADRVDHHRELRCGGALTGPARVLGVERVAKDLLHLHVDRRQRWRVLERMSTSIVASAEMEFTDVPPLMTPTLNVVFGVVGTWMSEMPAIARPSA